MFYNPEKDEVYENLEKALENLCRNRQLKCTNCPFDKIVPSGKDCRAFYKKKLANGEYVDPYMIAEYAGFELRTDNDEIEVSCDELNGLLGGVLS